MAENKKISELEQIQSLNDGDEFVVVDKSTTSGTDASSGGKTTRVTLSQIKDAVSASGAKGATGSQGAQGAQGAQGPKGDQGSQGAQGPKGDQGAQGAQGARGATGSAGSNGSTGAQGATGARGATGSQGQKGQAGSNGSNGSNGAKGQKGQAGSNGSNGSNGARGATGATGATGAVGNSNAHLLWSASNIVTNATGQELKKSISSGAWSTGYAHSNMVLTNGCSLSFSPKDTNTAFMLGLSTATNRNNTSRFANIDYAFYCTRGGPLSVYESGSNKGEVGKYSSGDLMTITYDNEYIRYYQNGGEITKFTKKVGAGKRFFVYLSIHDGNKVATSAISFVPAGSKGSTGATGAKGQKGATGTGQKGAAGASGTFAGGTVTAPILINSATDEKLILQGSSNTYIRFKEGTTNKAFIQWNASGYLHIHNNETDTRFLIQNASTKIQTKHGYADIGAMNTGHFHFQTDRSNFYFNKQLQVHGSIIDYASKATYYHSGNLSAVRKSFPGAGSTGHYGLDSWIDFAPSGSNNSGLYWSKGTGKGWHIYPKGTNDMYIRSGNATNTALAFTNNNATVRGYVYADNSNTIGFLNKDRSWRFRVGIDQNIIYGSTKSPNMWFQEGGVKTWTGDAGSNQGKIEYHSNRFYINAGSNSVCIVNFRRGGTNKSHIDNNGKFVGTATNADSLGGKAIPMSYGIKVTSQVDIHASNGKSGYINVDSNGFTRVSGRGAGVGLMQEDAYGSHEIFRFQNHGIASDKKRPVAIFGYDTLSARQQTTFSRGCFRIGAQNTQYEGGELQLQGPKTNGNAISIDFFDDSTLNYLQNNKSTHNVRFFNTENGAMFGAIGDKGAQFRRGFVKIINDHRGKNSHLYLQTTSSINKTIGNQKVSVGEIMNNFALLAINGQNDLNPATIMDSTSLWFRNNELHAGPGGVFNRSGDIKRGMKCAIDPYGNIISVRGIIANHKFSDARLKKDVVSLDSKTSLEKVKSLRGVTFRWKDDESDKFDGINVGLIAQEVQKVIPEIVSEKPRIENNDGSKETPDLKDRLYIEYSRVVPLLIESVKELSSTIDSLKSEIEDLKKS